MQRTVLMAWLSGLFALMAVTLALTALVVGWPVLLVALPLGGVAYLFYYHATGRLQRRIAEHARRRRRAEQERARKGRGPGRPGGDPGEGRSSERGPRGGWWARAAGGDPRAGPGRGGPAGGSARAWSHPRDGGDPGRVGEQARTTGMAPSRARAVLGVEDGTDPEAIRAAYRRKVKETHPDRGGDEEAFKRVKTAYETLDDR